MRALVLFCGSLPLVQACGGRSDTEEYLFGADDPIAVGGSAGGAGSVTAGRGGVAASGGFGVSGSVAVGGSIGTAGEPSVGGTGAGGTRTGVGGVSTGGIGTGGVSTGGVASAGTTGVAGTAGTAGGPSGPFISCGGDPCDTGTQTCCAGLGGLQCVAKGSACAGAVLGCTTNSDCGAGVCCLSITGDVSAASSCQQQCNVTGGGRNRQLCQKADECRPPFRYCTPTVFGVNICTRTGP